MFHHTNWMNFNFIHPHTKSLFVVFQEQVTFGWLKCRCTSIYNFRQVTTKDAAGFFPTQKRTYNLFMTSHIKFINTIPITTFDGDWPCTKVPFHWVLEFKREAWRSCNLSNILGSHLTTNFLNLLDSVRIQKRVLHFLLMQHKFKTITRQYWVTLHM